MDLKSIRSNIEVIVDKIWLFAESFESKDIRGMVDDIMKLIKEVKEIDY